MARPPSRCAVPVRVRQRQPRRAIAGYQAFVLVATIMLMLPQSPTVHADILVYQMLNDQIIEEFRDLPGTFGGEIPDTGMKVLADKADPADGCTEMRKPPPNSTVRFAVVIARYNCSFEVKVRNAQQAGYVMAIVHNVGSNDLEHMSASHPQDLLIPSVFVGESSGRSIIEAYTYERDYALVITDDIPFNISNNLIIPFAIVVGLCFLIMVLFMIIRCTRERRRTLRNRLPVRLLKKIGTVKFAKGMQYDTCAICLEDFVENEQLRMLPCHHAYHVECIDPWLTRNRRVCPICKRKVIVRGERRQPRHRSPSDSMSSSDTDEMSPLLNAADRVQAATAAAAALSAAAAVRASSSSSHPSAPGEESSPAVAPSSQGLATAAASVGVIQNSPGRTARTSQLPQQQQQQLQQNAVPRNHVVNMAPSDDDDELLDDRTVPNSWLGRAAAPDQQQPANESPYSPIGDEAALSRWQRFKRWFAQQPAPVDADTEDDDNDPEPLPLPPSPVATGDGGPAVVQSSNNILNVHLAGSFWLEETTDDDELIDAVNRDMAKRRQFRSAPDMSSTSAGGRVGVAALPNVNFNQNPPAGGTVVGGGSRAGAGVGAAAITGTGSSGTRGQPRRSRPRPRPNTSGGGSHIV